MTAKVVSLFPWPQLNANNFNAFWELWPKERRVDKKNAVIEWERLGPEDQIAVLQRLPAFRDYWRRNGVAAAFIKHPHRWLRDRRWEDEIDCVDLGRCCFNHGPYKSNTEPPCIERATVEGNKGSPYTGGVYCEAHAMSLGLVRRKA